MITLWTDAIADGARTTDNNDTVALRNEANQSKWLSPRGGCHLSKSAASQRHDGIVINSKFSRREELSCLEGTLRKSKE
jgi:hypothetical protein